MNMQHGNNLKMLAGMGAGAALMYFLDSRGGGRRRALVRDKAIKTSRKTREAVSGRAQDVRNRVKGAAHEVGLIDSGGRSRSSTRRSRV